MNRELLWNTEEFEVDAELAMHDLVETIKQYCPGDTLWISTDRADWRGSPGVKVVEMTGKSNEDIFREIMPNHDCTFSLYREDGQTYAIVSSHDIPTGAKWDFEGRKSCASKR